MKKTLLLVFIHGFRGGDDTFGNFPERLRALISRALPNVTVVASVYPKYETRGDLKECVARFREWLQNKVIDLEVANCMPSPTVDPSVHVILIGHSMGGIVGAETLLLLASEQPLPPPSSLSNSTSSVVEPDSFMFPHIQGLLAFDTPFLGIAPGVVSYGAEGQYKAVTTAYNTLTEVASVFGLGGNKRTSTTTTTSTTSTKEQKALPAATGDAASTDAAATPSWQRWGRYAMFAGAAGAVAAGGAAALYSQRERVTAGWSWVTSHLEFVGCLARTEDLRQRVRSLSNLHRDRGIGCADFYTCLGKGAISFSNSTNNSNNSKTSLSQKIVRSKYRTFCNLPADVEDEDAAATAASGLKWIRALNDKAADETKAHISMFSPKDNPAFYSLLRDSAELLLKWVDDGWYATATGGQADNRGKEGPTMHEKGAHGQDTDNGFMDGDDVVVVDK
ncbi:hypothetical protein VTN00DRAFT_9645 [Thermoascus crustaceus]|uniref:uncharacterized protein n=1 Tax=Thermoascus crustaceus TaxID=5088 RepID=UPI003743BFBE